MDDETLLKTMKNGLMVAGHEMGAAGDHWPAIHAVTKGVEEEFQTYQRDQAVVGELEFHLAESFRELEEIAKTAPVEEKEIILQAVKEMWERYYALLEPVAGKYEPSTEDLEGGNCDFRHLKAAAHILHGLGGRT